MKTYRLFSLVLLLILSLAVPGTYAYDCYSLSPSFVDGKTSFDKIIVRNLTEAEQNILVRLFKSLSGRWEGEAEDIECRGKIDRHSKEHLLFSIDAKVKTDYHGNLKLRTWLHSEAEKTKHLERMRLYLVDKKLRLDDTGGAGDVELIEVSKNRVMFLKRTGGGPGTLKREFFISLVNGDNAFTIEKQVYTQGRFTLSRVRHYRK